MNLAYITLLKAPLPYSLVKRERERERKVQVIILPQHVLSKVEDGWKESRDVREVLVPAWRDFVVVVVMRGRSWLTPQLKVSQANHFLVFISLGYWSLLYLSIDLLFCLWVYYFYWFYLFITDVHLQVKLAGDILEGLLQQVGSSEEPDQHLTLLLAEVYIALVKHCSK